VLVRNFYTLLDELEGDVTSAVEDFAETGDLVVLENRLDAVGSRAYALSSATSSVRQAIATASE
jgi:hypothetical protein